MAETKEVTEEVIGEAGKIMLMITEGKNPRGIPQAKFIVSPRIVFYISYSAQFSIIIHYIH